MARIKLAHTNASAEDNHIEAMIRCAALQAAATLTAGMVSGGNDAAAANNIRLSSADIRVLVIEVVDDVANFALEFEKHLRGDE